MTSKIPQKMSSKNVLNKSPPQKTSNNASKNLLKKCPQQMSSTNDGMMIVLSSPSGVGKTTLVKKIASEKEHLSKEEIKEYSILFIMPSLHKG